MTRDQHAELTEALRRLADLLAAAKPRKPGPRRLADLLRRVAKPKTGPRR
jgi:hypothetical protein